MGTRVREILSWYASDNPGAREPGPHAEHGPGRDRQARDPARRPGVRARAGPLLRRQPRRLRSRYHFELAIAAGCNAYAAPLGALEAGGQVRGGDPLILKLNNHDALHDERDPLSAVTGSVEDALRLGCAAIGFTIYPGSSQAPDDVRAASRAHPRGEGGGIAAWSGPTRAARASARKERPRSTSSPTPPRSPPSSARTSSRSSSPGRTSSRRRRRRSTRRSSPPRHPGRPGAPRRAVAFEGRRIVIFSGGATRDEELFEEMQAIRDGGGFGSIIGRNSFQRPPTRCGCSRPAWRSTPVSSSRPLARSFLKSTPGRDVASRRALPSAGGASGASPPSRWPRSFLALSSLRRFRPCRSSFSAPPRRVWPRRSSCSAPISSWPTPTTLSVGGPGLPSMVSCRQERDGSTLCWPASQGDPLPPGASRRRPRRTRWRW